jgi:hypothetical protein
MVMLTVVIPLTLLTMIVFVVRQVQCNRSQGAAADSADKTSAD